MASKANKFDSMNIEKTTGAGDGEEVLRQQKRGTSRQGQQVEASPEEQAERRAAGKTQGRKGCKATRINMAFWSDNHDFIKTMAKASGKTMTEYTNLVIERYRKEHPEVYNRAKALLEDLRGSDI